MHPVVPTMFLFQINGVEYAYGANGTKGLTGLFTCTPKHSPGYQFRTTIDFGDRFVTKQLQPVNSTPQSAYALVACDGREIIRAMASDYMGTDYDLFRKNCCTFAHDACIRLGVNEQEIPNWFHNLAAAGAVTQDAANSTLGPLTHAFTACELDKFAQYINDTAFDDGFEVIKACADSDNSEQIVDHTYR
jgi:PPPDE putative peptidase domain